MRVRLPRLRGTKTRIVPLRIGWGRKYPIQRDEYGWSLRERAFEGFKRGLRPAQVARELDAKPQTIYRYFADWKKTDSDFTLMYRIIRIALKDPQTRMHLAEAIAAHFEVPVKDILGRLEKPWATKQLLTGEWRRWLPDPEERRKWARLGAAGKLVELYVGSGVPPERVLAALERLRAEVKAEKVQEESAKRSESDGA